MSELFVSVVNTVPTAFLFFFFLCFFFCYAGRNRGYGYDLRYTSGFWIFF